MDSDNSNAKKELAQMSNEELIKAHQTGSVWVTNRMQVTGTNKNALGKPYDHDEFMLGLKRLEEIEDEMKKRGVTI